MPVQPSAAIRLSLALAALSLPTGPARAAGGFACTANNGPFGITADILLDKRGAGPIGRVSGSVVLKTPETPPDLAKLDLDTPALVHHWYEGEQLNLHFYKERAAGQPPGSIEAVITTRRPAKDDDVYRGRFRIKVRYFRKASDPAPVDFMVTGGAACIWSGP